MVLKLILKIQWIFVYLLSLFVIEILGVHAYLSKCSRGTCSFVEKRLGSPVLDNGKVTFTCGVVPV